MHDRLASDMIYRRERTRAPLHADAACSDGGFEFRLLINGLIFLYGLKLVRARHCF